MVFLSPSNQKSNTWAIGKTNEKVQAEAFADKLQALLEKQGVKVVRADTVNPFKRIQYAKGCKLYVPLHTNAYNKKVRGNRLYVYEHNKNTPAALAEENFKAMDAIRAEVNKLGMSRKPLMYFDAANWKELSNATAAGIPAVYSEAIFHDNVEDCNWYFENVDKLAESYAKGICKYLGVTYIETTPEAPKEAQKPENPVEEPLFRVQVGAFRNRKYAEALRDELKENGYDAFIAGG